MGLAELIRSKDHGRYSKPPRPKNDLGWLNPRELRRRGGRAKRLALAAGGVAAAGLLDVLGGAGLGRSERRSPKP